MPAPAEADQFRIETGGRSLASRAGLYGAGEARCNSVPDRRALESSYAYPSIGVVVSGTFEYRSRIGTLIATPGTVLLGNAREEFAYRYRDTDGVRRSVIALRGDLLAEVADSCGCDPRFVTAALPPSRTTAPLYGAIRRLAAVDMPLEETILDVTAAALGVGRGTLPRPVSETQRRSVAEVARYLNHAYSEPITLTTMALMARLSRFHFIRAFRSVMGENPRQYLIGARLRAAADRLIDTRESVTSVALGVGFNDLSHFNAMFRSTFGAPPCEWRKGASQRRRVSAAASDSTSTTIRRQLRQ